MFTDAAPVIAALRSNPPLFVVVRLFKALVPPTTPSNCKVPPLIVRLLVVAAEALVSKVELNLTIPDVIVDVIS